MAEILPLNFPIPSETAITTYSYTDIAEGTGVQRFYLSSETTDTTTNHILVTNAEPCSVFDAVNDKVLTILQSGSYDFDLTAFNFPKRIKGTATFAYIAETEDTDGFKLKFRLFRVRDAVETAISAQVTGQAISNTKEIHGFINIPITTLAHFKKGDILRFNVESDISDGTGISLGINPTNEAKTASPTMTGSRSSLYIPFLLDV